MELPDLNLLTYVIKLKGGRYYSDKIPMPDWAHPYSTDILVEANIYNNLAHAKRIRKELARGATVLPVSKKVFFKAILKGER